MNETTNASDLNSKIPTLNIGDKCYPMAALSDLARTQIANLQIVEAELNRLHNQIGIAQAAKAGFLAMLQSETSKLAENLPNDN